jgi:lipopolysaccharide export system protein LptA
VADRIQGQQILVNNTTEVFTVDGKTNTAASSAGSQRVKATITPRPKTNEVSPPPAGPVLKPSTRTGADKP